MKQIPFSTKYNRILYGDDFPRFTNNICYMVMTFGGRDNRKFSIAIFFKQESVVRLSESIDTYEDAWNTFGRLTRDPYKLLKNCFH